MEGMLPPACHTYRAGRVEFVAGAGSLHEPVLGSSDPPSHLTTRTAAARMYLSAVPRWANPWRVDQLLRACRARQEGPAL